MRVLRYFSYCGKEEYDKAVLEEVISSAMETGEEGIGFWGLESGTKEDRAWAVAREQVIAEKGIDKATYTDIFLRVLENGDTILIEDVEDEDEKWELTMDKLIAGMHLYEKADFDITSRIDECEFDAYDAQLIFQYALFGEEVYA